MTVYYGTISFGTFDNSEYGTYMGDKLWRNQQFWKTFWSGTDRLTNSQTKYLNGHQSSLLLTWIQLLMRSTKSHHALNKHRYIMKLLDQPELSDIAGIQDSQSYSPECTITLETTSSDIAGIQDSQSYSPECTITLDATTKDITGKQDSQSYRCQSVISPESISAIFSSEEFMDFKFKSWVWLCICKNEYLKLVVHFILKN